jgi:hypothetical protein
MCRASAAAQEPSGSGSRVASATSAGAPAARAIPGDRSIATTVASGRCRRIARV